MIRDDGQIPSNKISRTALAAVFLHLSAMKFIIASEEEGFVVTTGDSIISMSCNGRMVEMYLLSTWSDLDPRVMQAQRE